MKTTSLRRTRIDDNQLLKMRQDGLTHRDIAVAYGVSKNTIAAHLKRLDAGGRLSGKTRAPEPDSVAVPEPVVEPARTSGCSRIAPHLVGFERARRGFDLPHHKRDRYFALLKAGVPIAEAARQLGLSGGDRAS